MEGLAGGSKNPQKNTQFNRSKSAKYRLVGGHLDSTKTISSQRTIEMSTMVTDRLELTSTGFVCDHDSLTLEVLAHPHLHRLDDICPDAATALRYIWTWRTQRKKSSTDPSNYYCRGYFSS
jgi:hypothetical protein